MNRFEMMSFASADALAQSVAGLWLEKIAAANAKPQCVALSGGRISLRFFDAVVALARARAASLGNVHFFWADERCVPPADSQSCFAAAAEYLFGPLGIAAGKIHRIRGEVASSQAAELAAAEMRLIVPCNAAGQPELDLVFLGMGEDGHVASLFPGEAETAEQDPAVYRAIANSPKPPPNRVTLGYPALVAAREVWVLASGAGKEEALRESLRPEGRTPLARLVRLRSQTRVFTDISIG